MLKLPKKNRKAGFTLVEMLVAVVVLMLIIAVAAALTLAAQKLLQRGTQKMDADAQARLVFDRMAVDLALMLKRTDIDYIVKDSAQLQVGNDSMAFFAQASGYFSETQDSTTPDPAPRRSVSLLGYRVNSQTYQMERLAKGTGLNSNSYAVPMVFLPATLFGTWPSIATAGTGGVPNLNQSTDGDYQVLGDGVFRFEYCYILMDGTISNLPYLSTHTALHGWQDVSSLYVAIAVLDGKTRAIVPGASANSPQLTTAAGLLPDFTFGSGQLSPPIEQWQAVVNQSNFATQAHLPILAGSVVRIFARTIPINSLPSDSSL